MEGEEKPSGDLREEAERPLRRPGAQELDGLRGVASGTGIGSELFDPSPDPEVETEYPFMVLVCTECNEYHEHEGDWEVCPKCGEELTEVEKA